MIILNILLYYLVIIPISLLPFPLLYGLSDFVFVIFYYVTGYRKKVVLQNIKNSFPEKTAKEHNEICRKFYRHFCDLIVESIKTFTITERQARKRVVIHDTSLLDKYYEQKRSYIITGGHYNNWEIMAVAVDMLLKHKIYGIYTPLTNKFFDNKMKLTRSKYGMTMLSTKKVKHYFEENKNNLTAPIFAIDQSPSNPNNCYWMTFLNQDTGVLFGAEKYAKEYDYAVVFGRINKVKRGHYSIDFFDITDKPKETAYGEITEKTTRLLERDIREKPEYWLWSHRRWKHKKPENWTKKEKS